MKHRQRAISIWLGILVVTALFVSIGLEAVAQDGPATPTPTAPGGDEPNRRDPDVYYGEPATSTGNAEWTVASNTFTSNFPNGFDFTIEASSSAGQIEAATVVWSHAPRQITRRSADFDPETGVFSATWPGIEEDSVPPWVAVNYQWRFTDSEGNTYNTAWFRGEEYADNTNNWSRYESEDIIVFVQEGLPEDTGQQVMDAMAAQRETYRQAWGGLLSNKPRAILYANRQSFAQWRRGESNPRVIGQTSSDWGGTVQVISSGGVVDPVSYTHLRAHETREERVIPLLDEKKKEG
ncbi:MAG: hypothetical protein GYB66_00310, partial [Chloroflexi bacterium]|nr:hypothetical protein [Chloroflexota bacterium]